MVIFIKEHLGTILVILILFAMVTGALMKLYRDKKSGRSSCGCSCEGCTAAGNCHQSKRS